MPNINDLLNGARSDWDVFTRPWQQPQPQPPTAPQPAPQPTPPQNINIQVPQQQSVFNGSNASLAGGAGMAGVGAGAYYGSKPLEQLAKPMANMLTPEAPEKLRKFLDGTSQGTAPGHQFTNFINDSNDLLNSNIFNKPGGGQATGLQAMDSLYNIPGAKWIAKNYAGLDLTKPDTMQHYQQFAKSPLDAYQQVIKEEFKGNPNQVVDDIHSARMAALNKTRSARGSSFVQNLANELKTRGQTPGSINPDMSPSQMGDSHYQRATQIEQTLMKSNPAQYRQWKQNGLSWNRPTGNEGGAAFGAGANPLDQQAQDTLHGQAKGLYGSLRGTDVMENSDAFWNSLKPALDQSGMNPRRVAGIMASKDLSQIPSQLHAGLLEHMMKNGPQLHNDELIGRMSKSLIGDRANYRRMAEIPLAAQGLGRHLLQAAHSMHGGGRALMAGGAIAGAAGLAGKLFGSSPEYANYNVQIPGHA